MNFVQVVWPPDQPMSWKVWLINWRFADVRRLRLTARIVRAWQDVLPICVVFLWIIRYCLFPLLTDFKRCSTIILNPEYKTQVFELSTTIITVERRVM